MAELPPLILTTENYHSLEAEWMYMCKSQYDHWMECEAQQYAVLSGKWVREKTPTLLAGSYLHAWNEGKREQWLLAHPEAYTKGGKSLRADFETINRMIECLEKDPLAMYILEGSKEHIFTAEMFGIKWKSMVDVYNQDRRRIGELKSTKSIREKVWDNEVRARVSFLEVYNYPLQAALNCEIERIASGREPGDWYDMLMVAVSKEDVPDKEIILMNDPQRYVAELETVAENIPRIMALKSGAVTPNRCERCDYCRSTRMLKKPIHYSEL